MRRIRRVTQTQQPNQEAATYIAAMARDLSVIAQRGGLDALGYLLDIVRLEAERHSLPKSKKE